MTATTLALWLYVSGMLVTALFMLIINANPEAHQRAVDEHASNPVGQWSGLSLVGTYAVGVLLWPIFVVVFVAKACALVIERLKRS